MNLESSNPNPKPPPSSSSKKRLLSPNYKPKQSPTHRPDSDDELIFPPKKTRDLPNLSDCHSCGTHINHTNPQDRLLLLDSVWRILLLCRKCISRVYKLQLCPYCFKECGNLEIIKCRDCQRNIHKECVFKYGDSSPWVLSKRGGGEGGFVCVDCWVPEVLKKSIRIVKRKRVVKDSGKVGVSFKGAKNGNRMRVDLLIDGGREVVLALMAPNNCGSKNVGGKNALGVENGGKREGGSGGSGVVCYKRQRGGKGGGREDRGVKDGDGEGKSGRSDGVNELECSGIKYRRREKKLEWRTYEQGSLKRGIFLENVKEGGTAEVVGVSGPCLYERGSLKRKVFVETIKNASAEVVGISGPCLYERGSLKRKVFLETIKNASAEVVGISGTCQDSTRNAEITLSEVCNLNKLEHVYERKCTSHKKEVADNEKSDHCLLKYSKRQAIHKSQLSGQCYIVDRNQGSALESPVNCST